MRTRNAPPLFLLAFGASLLAGTLVASAADAEPVASSNPIRLNTIGYLPDADKVATLSGPGTFFFLVRTADNANVLSGKVSGPIQNPDTKEDLYTADFSSYTKPGQYRLKVPGVGESAPFEISADLYRQPFYVVMRGMYLWRCGSAVSVVYHNQVFAHAACHTNDAWLDYVGGGHVQKDGTGGWHDAGDYNKYIVNAGISVGCMFRAWEDFGANIRSVRLDIPESGGPIPDYLAELKYEMDWVLKMQAEDGSVYHKLTTRRFGPFIMPEAETEERYFTPWGSEATANFVGMTAQAARLFRPYDAAYADKCLRAAELSYRFLKDHPEYHKADQTGFRTGAYETNVPDHRLGKDPQNRLWAEAELWETTGSPEVLRDLETRIRSIQGKVDFEFDWDEVKDLGLVTYVSSRRIGRDTALVKQVRANIVAMADKMVDTARHHGYARPMGSIYYWGCNGSVARQTLILIAADRIKHPLPGPQVRGAQLLKQHDADSVYRETCLDALNHLFGRNYQGRSYVTGLGFEPPMNPHDRRAGADNVLDPWPGYLVGGPHPGPKDWHDVQASAVTNEIAINWNAALIYALAAFLP